MEDGQLAASFIGGLVAGAVFVIAVLRVLSNRKD